MNDSYSCLLRLCCNCSCCCLHFNWSFWSYLSLFLCLQNATGRLWALVMDHATGHSRCHSSRIWLAMRASVSSPSLRRQESASFSLSACSVFAARPQSKTLFTYILHLICVFVINNSLPCTQSNHPSPAAALLIFYYYFLPSPFTAPHTSNRMRCQSCKKKKIQSLFFFKGHCTLSFYMRCTHTVWFM